jgi:hypothetical protein
LPGISGREIRFQPADNDIGVAMARVAGNTAVTTPEPAEFVAVAPATVKKFAATPVKVYPVLGVSVMVAV